MVRLIPFLIVCVVILVVQDSRAAMPCIINKALETELPVGKWKIDFANGVIEECQIGDGGVSSVDEPKRSSNGMAAIHGNAVVITFNDDRVERWTPVGKRYVVEHWFPASRLPTTTPVLGIAEKMQ